MVTIFSFLRRGKVEFRKTAYGWIVYYNGVRVIYLLRIATGNYVAVKNVNISVHRGLGQYFVYYKKVATAKDVIDAIEEKFGNMIVAYAVRFYDYNKFLGVVIYDYNYYFNNRKLIEHEGYELQYAIELPEGIEDYINKAKNLENRFFRIMIDENGKVKEEWIKG